MQLSLRRVAAASIPVAMLAGSALATNANPVARPGLVAPRAPFARQFARPFTVPSELFGGGATLPIIAYIGGPLGTGTVGQAAAGNGSVFGFWESASGGHAPTTQYCATGSGKGKGVFTGPAATVQNLCSNAASGTGTVGFAASTGQITEAYPNLTGSDAPLSQSDYTTFITNNHATQNEPVELPSIIGSIAMFYHNGSISGRANLTDADICGIVLGTITDWSKLSGKFAPKPLHLVYRTDGSGTTFNFSNHLSAVCKSTLIGTTQQFTTPPPPNPPAPPYVVANPPPGSIGAKGNSGIVSTVVANDGAIGYAETANTLSSVAPPNNYATVNGQDPVKNLPEAAASIIYSNTTVAPDSAVVTAMGKPATTVALTGVPKKGCVQLVKPQGYAVPPKGYSIDAVTYLLFSANGNNGASSVLQSLVKDLNTPADFAAGRIVTVNAASKAAGTGTTGYSALGSSFNSSLIRTAQTCIGA